MSNGELVHPDYAKWHRLRLQMSRQQVLDLMGRPLVTRGPHLEYGHIAFDQTEFRHAFKFLLWFDNHDRLAVIEHPFQGQRPREGKPSAPVIYAPQPGGVYAHYPRFLDIRWSPSTGSYPMKYQLQYLRQYRERFIPEPTLDDLVLPHYILKKEGVGYARVRIRAVNSKGKSPWSSFSDFTFTR